MKTTNQELAKSLTAKTTDILPHIPYILQDLWELGSGFEEMLDLVQRHIEITSETKILDLGCGKGAISIQLAKELQIEAVGIDIIPEFIEEAKQKAKEYQVDKLCHFEVGNLADVIGKDKDYDIVIWGALGDIFLDYLGTLEGLKKLLKPQGFILFDDGYINQKNQSYKFSNHQYYTYDEWLQVFEDTNLELLDTKENTDETGVQADDSMKLITKRAKQLIEIYPDQKEMFEEYIQSQQDEYDDLEESVIGVTWLLKKNENQ